ncbi:MAG TPA: pitrilysin family protein [Thermoanaerobaculia bacterium]|nr:pitrilysin family protein [Thermoanaerobaculia bacterium]
MKRSAILTLILLTACTATLPPSPQPTPPVADEHAHHDHSQMAVPPLPQYTPGEPRVATLDSRAPLITMRVMITHGATSDPAGKEGLAAITADAVTDGGFRRGNDIVTKEELAEQTVPWGSGARPTVFTSSRTTTFFFTAPRDVIGRYVTEVLRPMLTQPVFEAKEIDRLKNETVSQISSLRSEDLEGLGLAAIDQFVLAGTGYAHHVLGRETAVQTITRDDVIRFYRDFYRPENAIIGISTTDPAIVDQVREAVRNVNRDATTPSPAMPVKTPEAFTGRQALVIQEPNAPAASVHLGFPIAVNRTHPDYWPLYIANVWLGTHRDSFGQLYQKLREERGYNYGNYSYIEYWAGRPNSLFQIFNQPREQQYFSLWVRPVKHEHAVHLAKAITYELEQLIRTGLTPEQVEESKKKARVLYLNLGETVPRLVGARVDDAFHGLAQGNGFLDRYIQSVDAVTVEQVNAAIRRHLSTANVKYVIVTSTPHLAATQQQLASNTPVFGKSWTDYEFTTAKLPDGTTVWQVPEAKLPTVQLDAVWAAYPLNIERIEVRNVNELFK